MKQKYNTIHELYACNKHRRYNKIGKNRGGLECAQRREADPDVMLLLPPSRSSDHRATIALN
jgi:hypothetical protein